jgi:hypothetical protein
MFVYNQIGGWQGNETKVANRGNAMQRLALNLF